MAEFSESLDALWAVQKHDAVIVRQREQLAKLERENQAEQAKVDAAKTNLEERRAKLRKLQSEHKELEQELQRLDARVKQLDAQGTEAGMEAAAKQRAKIDELETQGLELLTAVTIAEQEVQVAETELKQKQEVQAARLKVNADVAAAAQQLIEATEAARATAAAQVTPELLQVYDEVNARNPGKALAKIAEGFCSACSGEINTQLAMQVRARKEILRCPHCTRILDA
jgi:predicted  nucleic acid-binding Zn-ribbon protein